MKTLSFVRARTLAALLVAGLAVSNSVRAVTITNYVDTPATLSFNFSGSGLTDFVSTSLPLANWAIGPESHSQNNSLTNGLYGFSLANLSHLSGGAVLATLGNGNTTTPFGTSLSDTKTVSNGTGTDTYFVSITVNNNGSGQWGAFSGSFLATHTVAGVPDGGSTAILAGTTFLLLAGLPRKLRARAVRGIST